MPKKASVTKEMIISVAIDIVQNGESLNVRAVASKLGCSIQPVFYNFATMDELKKEIADVTKQMKKAAADLNFELAAQLRDRMVELKKHLHEVED